jgi:hypothetical protein
MQWYVMRYWKKRGVQVYDWGGEGTYKEKYGCVAQRVPWFIKSRYQLVGKLRDGAKKIYRGKQRLINAPAVIDRLLARSRLVRTNPVPCPVLGCFRLADHSSRIPRLLRTAQRRELVRSLER